MIAAWLAARSWPLAGAAALALLLILGAQTLRLASARTELAETKAAWATQRESAALVARAGEAAARNEEERRRAAQQEAHDESQRFSARARADDDLRRNADAGLQHTVASVASSCRGATGDPAAAAVRQATSSPGDLLAYVQRRMGEAAGGVVGYADQLRAAGSECAGRYEALIQPAGGVGGPAPSEAPRGSLARRTTDSSHSVLLRRTFSATSG